MSAEFTIASHFVGKTAVVREIYDELLTKLREIGPIHVEPKKTSIHLNNRSAFAGVATRKTYLLLNIKSDHPLASPRIHKAEQISASRYHQEIKLEKVADVDQELIVWLQAGYKLSA